MWDLNGFNEEDVNKAREGFKPLEPGRYEVFVTGVDPYKVSSQKQTPGIELRLTVRDDVEQEGKGRKVFDTIWVTEKTKARVFAFLQSCGVEDPAQIGPDQVKDAVLGKAFQAELEINKYTDKDGNEKSNNRLAFMGFYPPAVDGEATPDMLAINEDNGSAPQQQTGNADPFAGDSKPIDLSDDDLPF